MKDSEKKLLIRLYSALDIPASGGGTQSMSIAGVAGHSRDAGHAIDKARDIIRQFYQGEDWHGSIEEALSELENWRSRRVSDKWKLK